MDNAPAVGAAPHSGLRVVEVGDSAALGYCGKLLTAIGSDVVKIRSATDRSRYAPGVAAVPAEVREAYLDGGKTVLEADLEDPATGTLVRELAGTADVLLTALPDGAHAGLADEALRRERPGLVIARCPTLEPVDGSLPLGGDYQALAASGLMALIGEPDRPPLRLPGAQAEYAGALVLFTGVVFALYGRRRDGSGARVRTSSLRAAAYLDWKSQIFYEEEGRVLRRGSDSGPLVLRCRDGFVGFYYRPEEWPAVRRFIGDVALEDERFATQQLRDAHRAELREILERFTSTRPKSEVYHSGQAAGIPVGAVWTMAELLDDDQFRSRSFVERRCVSGAELTAPAVPWTVDGERPVEPSGATEAGTQWLDAARAAVTGAAEVTR